MHLSSSSQKSKWSCFVYIYEHFNLLITPHSVSAAKCNHLVLDAGHIAIESNLADKEAIRDVQGKKNRSYSSADFERLESLMYDNFSVKLNDAQV